MTKHEYLSQLLKELKKNRVPDAEEIIIEYEQHFAFKLADGFTEEAVAAKLGDPSLLALQFEENSDRKIPSGRKTIILAGLITADVFSSMFFILLAAWGLILGIFSVSIAVIGICLLLGLNLYSLIPPIPYWCGAVFAISFLALAILSGIGGVYFTAFLRQMIKAYGRFHSNILAGISGKAVLPSLAIHPKLGAKKNRRLRTAALLALAVFAVCFVAGILVSVISSGQFQFWHAWSWFV